jgi:ABC-type polar amino acid transport system ATPase subunit
MTSHPTPGENATIASLVSINKWYGAYHALRDVDLQVAPGERVVICGPSGSGKSTLVRTVNLLEPFQQGRLHVCGVDVGADEITRAARLAVNRRVGMVFQQFNLFPHMSVLENLTVGPVWGRGVSRKEADELAMHYLQRVGLLDHAQKHPAQLSGGQQQRVAIARALLNEPAILLADEPTGNLDVEAGAEVLRLLRAGASDGRAVVMVTHEASAASIADRVLRLVDGRLEPA